MNNLASLPASFADNPYEKHDLHDCLNLIGAAESHLLWKARLGHHVRGSISEPVESSVVGQDGICLLSVWINGNVFAQWRDTDEYFRLTDSHRRFHQHGDEILGLLKAGDHAAAERIFEHQYSPALRQIIQSLAEINQLVQGSKRGC